MAIRFGTKIKKASAALMAVLTAACPMAAAVPVSAATNDDDDNSVVIESVSEVEDTAVVETETQSGATVFVKVKNAGGKVDVTVDGEKTSYRADDKGAVKKEDKNTKEAEAVTLTEDGYCAVITKEEGTVVRVEAVADDAYNVAEYSVTTDAGAEQELTSPSASVKYDVTAQGNKVVTIAFAAAEKAADEEADVKAEEENGLPKLTTEVDEAAVAYTMPGGEGFEHIENLIREYAEEHPELIAEIEDTVSAMADTKTVTIDNTGLIAYGGYNTHAYRANGRDRTAFCVQPALSGLGSGTYTATNLDKLPVQNIGDIVFMKAVTYNAYGAPGYNQAKVQAAYEKYCHIDRYAFSHLVLSCIWYQYAIHNGYTVVSWANGQPQSTIDGVNGFIDAIMHDEDVKKDAVGFDVYYIKTPGCQDMVFWETTTTQLYLKKVSANPSLTNGNANFSLEGAIYTVYADSTCTKYRAQLKTDAKGVSNTVKLDAGTYYVKETKAPKGFAADKTVHKVKLVENQTTVLKVEEKPNNNGKLTLIKESTNPDMTNGNPCYSLKGTTYQVFGKENDAKAATGNVEQNKKLGSYVGTLVCNEDGTTNTISNILPGTYYYVEVVAGKGYRLNDVVEDVEVKSSAEPTVIHTSDVPDGDPAGFAAVKINAETGKPVTADTTSKGAQITVKYFAIPDNGITLDTLKEKDATRTWNIVLNKDSGNGRFVGVLDEMYMAEDSDPLYKNADGVVIIPLGYITVQETGAPKNYALKNATITAPDGSTISDKDGVVMGRVVFNEDTQKYILMYGNAAGEMLTAANNYDFEDVPLRGDMEFIKVDENDKPLKNVMFRLERLSVSDGHVIESHVIQTDDDGRFSTANEYAAHDHNTNGGKAGDGTWFGECDPDNGKGALPAGNYRLQEIRTKANKSFKMETVTFSVDKNGETVVVNKEQSDGKIVDTKITIKTTAKGSASKSHYEVAGTGTGITDTVEYAGLNKGDVYKLVATLMDKSTGSAVEVDGKVVKASKEFTAESADGSVDVELKFDATGMDGKDVVVFEKLYVVESDLNGEEIKEAIATHEKIDDDGQTVHFPKIGTKVVDDGTGTNTTAAVVDAKTHEATINLTDTISLQNVEAGKEYIAKGRVVDENGNPFLDKDGKEVTAESEPFKLEDTNGTAEVHFSFVISEKQKDSLAGKHIVIFEVLTDKNGSVYGKHEDINDKEQTINFPQLETTAADLDNGTKNVMADEEAAIADTVDYKGLLPEKEYTIKPTLHIAEEKDGKVVESEKTVEVKAVALADKTEDRKSAEEGVKFTTPALTEEDKANGKTTVDGSVKIAIFYDASALVGERVVVFEDLYDKELLIATHHDIADEDQTVYHPSVHTTAIDDGTKTQNTAAGEGQKIVDTVAYENCLPETEYAISGVLMDKATGKPVLDKTGKEVTATAKFTTAKAASEEEKVVSGTTEVTFELDATGMDGKTLVVFEELYVNGEIKDENKVAEHKDINDIEQTIFVPVIRTNATDVVTGTHAAMPSATTTIEDKVTYENLLPGKEYEMEASLVEKESKQPLVLIADNTDGKEVTDVEKPEADATEPTVGTWVFHAESKEFSISLYKDGKEVAAEKTENGEDIVFANIPFGEYDVRFYDNTVVEDVDENGNPTALLGPARAEKMTFTYEMSEEYKASAKDSETAESGKDNAGTTQTVKFTTPELTEEQKKNGETTVSGSVLVKFVINSLSLEGKTVVAFEKLYYQGKELAVHADINDEEQSVHFPKIKTTLKNASGETKNILAAKGQKVTDTVEYKNLVPGEKYKAVCTLMDKKTGKAILSKGKPVTGEAEFVPDKADGTVDVVVTFDATGLEGSTVVAFEKVYLANGEIEVAHHEDINDVDQSIYVPKISTSLKDGKDGDKNVLASNSTTVIDTVKYDGLEDGKEYRAVCTLMDKSTGKAVSVNGKLVTGEATFKAKGSSGSVDVKVTFNASGLGGRKLVAFEKLYAAGGKVEVAHHEDINDKEQTVTMVTPPSTPGGKTSTVRRIQTGDPYAVGGFVGAAVIFAALAIFFLKRRQSDR